MRLLLDTHIFLWYVTFDVKLSATHAAAVRNPANQVYLSVASNWEAIIKHRGGKLPLPQPAAKYLEKSRIAHNIETLAVYESTMPYLEALPHIHRDPFDRILIAQAIEHSLTIATVDAMFRQYSITVI